MNNFIIFLKSKLDLSDFTLLKTGYNKLVIFKCCTKYTKCIYINFYEENIEIKIDKVFDFKGMNPRIERLMISKKVFNDMDKTLNYIRQNMIV
jgi:hypothetical protein